MLIRRHRARVYRIALRMLGNHADAEDVTQDVAITIWRGLSTFTGSARFTTWLHRIVVNRCLNSQRDRRPELTAELTAELTRAHYPVSPGSEAVAIAGARARATLEAIAALPPEQRSVFVLAQLEGLSYREVATILAVSEAAVRSRLARARRSLVHRLRDWA